MELCLLVHKVYEERREGKFVSRKGDQLAFECGGKEVFWAGGVERRKLKVASPAEILAVNTGTTCQAHEPRIKVV